MKGVPGAMGAGNTQGEKPGVGGKSGASGPVGWLQRLSAQSREWRGCWRVGRKTPGPGLDPKWKDVLLNACVVCRCAGWGASGVARSSVCWGHW